MWILSMTNLPTIVSKEKFSLELGSELLKSRRCLRRLSCMFKVMENKVPEYLKNIIPKPKQNLNTRKKYIPSYKC